MAKQPYIQFYIGDYIKDTRVLPLNVKGGWVDLILAMWDNDPKGEITGTIEDFSRVMNCTKEESILVIQTLKQKKIFAWVDLEDGQTKIISRKQKRMEKLSETRKKVGELGGNPVLVKQMVNQHDKIKDKLNPEYEYEYENISNKVFNTMPILKNFNGLPEIKIGAAKELVRITSRTEISDTEISDMWEVFKIQNLTGNKYYSDEDAVYSHFINWIKTQKFDHGNKSNNTKISRNSGAVQLLDEIKKDAQSRGK